VVVVVVLVVVAMDTQLEVQSQRSKHTATITWPSTAAATNHHQCHHTPVAWRGTTYAVIAGPVASPIAVPLKNQNANAR
jgi:hypothetical protein